MKRFLLDNLKNIPGWHTREKLVVFSVDDYGNVRLDSAAALERLKSVGFDMSNRFDRFDALETRQDLEALFEVLSSVQDQKGRSAVFTPYALCANPDFEAIRSHRKGYCYEILPDTFERLASDQPQAYSGAWDLWKEGIRQQILRPQFHGREHLNVELFERKLKNGDKTILANLENQSLVAVGDEPTMPGVGFTQAFDFYESTDVENHKQIIAQGIEFFESVFGVSPVVFTPPAQKLHTALYDFVEAHGIRGIDKPLIYKRRIDRDEKKREINSLGMRRGQRHVTIVRNVVFEPTSNRNFDSVGHAVDQITAAFRWQKPAIVSSHRVNFCGHIDPENRNFGLNSLRRLLREIVSRWPDVQFVGADQLVERISLAAP